LSDKVANVEVLWKVNEKNYNEGIRHCNIDTDA